MSLGQRLWNGVSAWVIRASGYQKLGLRREDLYMEDRPEVQEAIRRLPEEEQYERLFRLKRALDLSMKKAILPLDQWTTPEQDILYLKPYILQVQKEMKEKKMWEKL